MRMFGRWRWRPEVPGLLLLGCITVVYLALVPAHVLGGDNGEFALLAQAQGIAHPPGYPLYVALLRLLHGLPAASPVQAAGYATALMAAVQMSLLYLACRCWRIPALASAVAVGVYAASPLAVQHLTHAEVFALNGAIVAALLAVCSPFSWLTSSQQIAAIGVCCGLGLAHHHSFVLVAPVIAFGLVSAFGRVEARQRWRLAGGGVVALAVGFAPTLLLFPWSQANGVYLQSWGVIDGWPAFWHHFLRRDYGTFSLAASSGGRHADWIQHMGNVLNALNAAFKVLLPFAPLAFVVRLRSWRVQDAQAWAWLALLLSFVVAGPLFFSRANINPVLGSPAMEVLQRFYLLPCQLLVLPVAEGLSLSAQFVLRLYRPRAATAASLSGPMQLLLASALVLYAFGLNVALSIRQTRVSRGPHTQNFVKSGLRILPHHALLVVRADDEMYAGSYLQEAEGFRRDLVFVNAGFLLQKWYIPRLSRTLVGCRWPGTTLVGFFETLVQTCRLEVFLTLADDRSTFAKELYARYPNYQYGPFRRVLPQGSKLPDAESVFRLNQRLFSTMAIPDRQVSLAHGWASWPYLVYGATWKQIARDMERASRPDLAAAARRLALRYGYCRQGDCLAD